MSPEQEGQLLRLMVALEQRLQNSDGQVGSLRKAIGALSKKVDKLHDAHVEYRVQGERMNGRLANVERRVVSLETSVETVTEATGEHDLREIKKQLAKAEGELNRKRESRTHWSRYAIQTLVGLLLAAGGAVAGLYFGG